MNIIKTAFIFLLLVSVLGLAPQTKAQSGPKMIVVPDDFNSIQQAVDAANEGQTVFVKEGTYHESVIITKPLSLIGENEEATKIVGSWRLNGTAVLVRHNNVTISGFTIESVRNSVSCRGVHLLQVRFCKVSNCIFQLNYVGVWLYEASGNIIEKNHINGMDSLAYSNGIYLKNSHNNIIQENTIEEYEYGYGILLSSSTKNKLNTNLLSNCIGAISFTSSADNNTLTNNQITASRDFFEDETENLILGSYGLKIQSSSNNWANQNTFLNVSNAVQLISSFSNTVENSRIINCINYGIGLANDANNNTILENKISNNKHGIQIARCSNNKLRNNEISGNINNLWVNGTTLEHYMHDIDPSNTVDSKPVYYWVNQHNKTVPPDAGQVTLVKCTNITVTGVQISNNYNGLVLAYTSNCTITKTEVIANYFGIKLFQSTNNTLVENNIKHNYWAIWLGNSKQNTIINNNIQENYKYGLLFFNANNNVVAGNNIQGNWIGAGFDGCSNNVVYHNNFITNQNYQVKIQKTTSENVPVNNGTQIFDKGPILGGNYWSDYNGTDSNGDGIGNEHYLVSEYLNNTDTCPLMVPVEINIVPEFPSWIILPLFVISTLSIAVYRKKTWRHYV